MEKEKKDWYSQLYPEVPSEYPPDLKINDNKPYRITFEEVRPRVVNGGYGKKTAVIIVTYEGQKRSLYAGSNVDLARQVKKMCDKHKSLMGLTIDVTRTCKKGRHWLYKVNEVLTNAT